MAKQGRVQRPKDELKRELAEQLQLLRHACKTFDNGLEAVGKHIALSLRVLIHQHGQSRALLEQLNLRPNFFLDSAGSVDPRNLSSTLGLVLIHGKGSMGYYRPLISASELSIPMRQIRFVNWWNGPVMKDQKEHTFSRRQLVLHVADTDGGAHVDPELDEAYMALSRENSLGWQIMIGDITKSFEGRPELASMRQIAHEVLSTIHRFVPAFKEHAEPVIPDSNT